MSIPKTTKKSELHISLGIPKPIGIEIHNWAEEQDWPDGTELEPIEKYHITMLLGDVFSAKEQGWPEDQHAVTINGIKAFPSKEKGEGKDAIVLAIESDTIREHHGQLADRAEDHGIEISPFSRDDFKPHMTIAYGSLPKGLKPPKLTFETETSSVSPPRPDQPEKPTQTDNLDDDQDGHVDHKKGVHAWSIAHQRPPYEAELLKLADSWEGDSVPYTLYHGTHSGVAEQILRKGLKPHYNKMGIWSIPHLTDSPQAAQEYADWSAQVFKTKPIVFRVNGVSDPEQFTEDIYHNDTMPAHGWEYDGDVEPHRIERIAKIADSWAPKNQWPNALRERSAEPADVDCTCKDGHKLDCPCHGLHPVLPTYDDTLEFPDPASPVGYDYHTDAPRTWMRAETKVAGVVHHDIPEDQWQFPHLWSGRTPTYYNPEADSVHTSPHGTHHQDVEDASGLGPDVEGTFGNFWDNPEGKFYEPVHGDRAHHERAAELLGATIPAFAWDFQSKVAAKKKLWVDDTRRPPDDSWDWAHDAREAKKLTKQNDYKHMSLDHDLGILQYESKVVINPDALSGGDFVLWLHEHRKHMPKSVNLHTHNSNGAKLMKEILEKHTDVTTDRAADDLEEDWAREFKVHEPSEIEKEVVHLPEHTAAPRTMYHVAPEDAVQSIEQGGLHPGSYLWGAIPSTDWVDSYENPAIFAVDATGHHLDSDPEFDGIWTPGGAWISPQAIPAHKVRRISKLSSHQLAWLPGSNLRGKGLVTPSGDVHTWPVDKHGIPHHAEYIDQRQPYQLGEGNAHFFQIRPRGGLDTKGYNIPANVINHVLQTVPSLRAGEHTDWHFAKMTPPQQERFRAGLEDEYGPEHTPVLHRFADGWTVRHLPTWNEMGREGEMMHHCWSGFGSGEGAEPVEDNQGHMTLSLRDQNNWPHASFSFDPSDRTPFSIGVHGGEMTDDEEDPHVQRIQEFAQQYQPQRLAADQWDTREYPDARMMPPTTMQEPAQGNPHPEKQGCTCDQQHKLDCPVHGLNPTEEDFDHSWSIPQGHPVGYPQDQPRNYMKAEGAFNRSELEEEDHSPYEISVLENLENNPKQWEPGTRGKAIITPEGKSYEWSVEPVSGEVPGFMGGPHHASVERLLGLHEREKHLTADIFPNGAGEPLMGDRALTAYWDRPLSAETWNFGRGNNEPATDTNIELGLRAEDDEGSSRWIPRVGSVIDAGDEHDSEAHGKSDEDGTKQSTYDRRDGNQQNSIGIDHDPSIPNCECANCKQRGKHTWHIQSPGTSSDSWGGLPRAEGAADEDEHEDDLEGDEVALPKPPQEIRKKRKEQKDLELVQEKAVLHSSAWQIRPTSL